MRLSRIVLKKNEDNFTKQTQSLIFCGKLTAGSLD
jgi:hypothetical protein